MNTERALKLIKNRKLLTILGAILLGVVGNGLWEYVVNPLLFLSRDTLLNIATLGIRSFKDDCYRLIARGFTESASLSLLSEFNALYITACFLFALHLFYKVREVNAKNRELDEIFKKSRKQDENQDPPQQSKPSIEDWRRESRSLIIKLRLLVWFLVVLAAFLISSKTLNIVKYNYVNSAITHYKQMVSVCRPYITEKEVQLIESKFSQISSREDYSSLMAGLYEISEKNQISYKKFTPW